MHSTVLKCRLPPVCPKCENVRCHVTSTVRTKDVPSTVRTKDVRMSSICFPPPRSLSTHKVTSCLLVYVCQTPHLSGQMLLSKQQKGVFFGPRIIPQNPRKQPTRQLCGVGRRRECPRVRMSSRVLYRHHITISLLTISSFSKTLTRFRAMPQLLKNKA